jgi:hypothetical protein
VFRINARHLLLEDHIGPLPCFRRGLARVVCVLSGLARSGHGPHVLAIGVPLWTHFIVIPHAFLLVALSQTVRSLLVKALPKHRLIREAFEITRKLPGLATIVAHEKCLEALIVVTALKNHDKQIARRARRDWVHYRPPRTACDSCSDLLQSSGRTG